MGLGGPVWHVSVASRGLLLAPSVLEQVALEQLAGVGDATLGEWRDARPAAFHLRRRLSAIEQLRVGDVKDIRGTREARQRVLALPPRVRKVLPVDVLAEETGGR